MSEVQLTVIALFTFATLAFVLGFGAAFGIYCAKGIGSSIDRLGKAGWSALSGLAEPTGSIKRHDVHKPARKKNMESDSEQPDKPDPAIEKEDDDGVNLNTEVVDA